jgi:predicted ATPase
LALEGLYGQQEEQLALIAAQLARHFQEAGLIEKAIDYRLLAGQQAVKVAANQEAISHYQAGLALLQRLPDTPERAQRELTLQIALGVPVTASKGYAHPAVEPIYARARELSSQLGETTGRFPALYGLWRMSVIRGALSVARDLGHQLMELAQQTQEADLLLEADRAVGVNAFHLGELARARTFYEQGLTLYNRERHHDHAFLYGHDPAVSCLGYLAHTLWLLGYPDQALARGAEVLRLAQTLAHPFSLGHACVWGAALLHQLRQEAGAVQAVAQQGVDLALEHRFSYWETVGTILLGWSLAEQDQATRGLALLQQGIVNWRADGASINVPYFLALLAETHGRLGQLDAGLAAIAQAMEVMAQTGERWYEAELHRLQGELLLAAGAPDGSVEAHFHQSLAVARRQQARSLELRATMSLCRLWRHRPEYHEARQMLAALYGWFTEGFDTPDLLEAKSLLTQ